MGPCPCPCPAQRPTRASRVDGFRRHNPEAALCHEPRWYACHTRALAEGHVRRLLERAGFEAYLPLVEREREWADRTKRVEFPLFPGYTFARFALPRFADVVRTPGLMDVVGGGAGPTPVRDEELDAVRRLALGAGSGGGAPELVDWWTGGSRARRWR